MIKSKSLLQEVKFINNQSDLEKAMRIKRDKK